MKPVRVIRCDLVESNPNMPEGADANHYKVTLGYGRRRLTVHFSQGYMCSGEPTADRVMECLVMDSIGADGVTFEEWASEYGYDMDSRKAERIFKTVQRLTGQLKRFLGDDYAEARNREWD